MLTVRTYGTSGRCVAVLHGGPGAAGYLAPVARALAGSFRVLEPLQRGSGERPLTVRCHVDDLHEVLSQAHGSGLPALVGHSWGAMLALAYAAAYPGQVAAVVLIGCGTFDTAARDELHASCDARISDELRERLRRLDEEISDPHRRLQALGDLLLPIYSCDPLTTELELTCCDARAHHETWNDMIRLQKEGVYPAAFARIPVPVLMLHGADDPHPGKRIRDGLAEVLPQLEYHSWERCGHYPWLERSARDAFFSRLIRWLDTRLSGA
jgi:pimeloyl-ACP methyl ester carboxylesterase